MKRSRVESDEPPSGTTLSSFPFNDIPVEARHRILSYHKSCSVALVSKSWFETTLSYPNWYEEMKHSLTHLSMDERMVCMLDHDYGDEYWISVSNLMRRVDQHCSSYHQEFKNRLALFLRKAFLMYMRGKSRNDVRKGSIMFNTIYEYLKQSAPNAKLTIANFHPRDFRITFFEKNHRYNLISREHPKAKLHYVIFTNVPSDKLSQVELLMGIVMSRYMISTTRLIEDLFNHFDEDEVIKSMMSSPWWPQNALYGKTPDEIKELWQLARELGTSMHANIEAYYTGRTYRTDTKEWTLFVRFEGKYVKGILLPYRSEWLVYAECLKLTGSIDMLYKYADPLKFRDEQGRIRLVLGDWKRANKLCSEYKGKDAKKGSKPCTEHLYDTKLAHYRIQVMIYAWILVNYYDVVIEKLFILGLHPDREDYDYIEVGWDQPLIDSIIAYRRSCVDAPATTVKEFIKESEVLALIEASKTAVV